MRYLDRAKTPLHPAPIMITGERDGITVEARDVVERQLPREHAAASPTTSRSATAAPISPASAAR